MKKVKSILDQKGSFILSVSPDVTVYEAVRVMGENNVGSVLVMDGGQLIGILTERDYARKVVLQGRYSATTFVREIMKPYTELVTVSPETTVEECMKLMTMLKTRHLPVVEDGELKGLVSIGDVVYAIIHEQEDMIDHMTHYLYVR